MERAEIVSSNQIRKRALIQTQVAPILDFKDQDFLECLSKVILEGKEDGSPSDDLVVSNGIGLRESRLLFGKATQQMKELYIDEEPKEKILVSELNSQALST